MAQYQNCNFQIVSLWIGLTNFKKIKKNKQLGKLLLKKTQFQCQKIFNKK
jgi:hypothetical protein